MLNHMILFRYAMTRRARRNTQESLFASRPAYRYTNEPKPRKSGK